MDRPDFQAGKNIAIKVPTPEYDAVVQFYRDVIGLPLQNTELDSNIEMTAFAFGDVTLWVDQIAGLSQAETWFEIVTHDIAAAEKYLEKHGVVRRDEIEPLPQNLKAFWISGPGNIIHLINEL